MSADKKGKGRLIRRMLHHQAVLVLPHDITAASTSAALQLHAPFSCRLLRQCVGQPVPV